MSEENRAYNWRLRNFLSCSGCLVSLRAMCRPIVGSGNLSGRWNMSEGIRQRIKSVLISKLLLWATGTQSCWGPFERLWNTSQDCLVQGLRKTAFICHSLLIEMILLSIHILLFIYLTARETESTYLRILSLMPPMARGTRLMAGQSTQVLYVDDRNSTTWAIVITASQGVR